MLGPPKDCIHSCDHLHHAERFCQEIIRACIQTDDFIELCSLGSCHDHRDLLRCRIRFQFAEDLHTILTRQHDIQHDQFRNLSVSAGFLQSREQLAAVVTAARLKP